LNDAEMPNMSAGETIKNWKPITKKSLIQRMADVLLEYFGVRNDAPDSSQESWRLAGWPNIDLVYGFLSDLAKKHLPAEHSHLFVHFNSSALCSCLLRAR
jgi:hypothetical protein